MHCVKITIFYSNENERTRPIVYNNMDESNKYKVKGIKASHKRLPTVCTYLYKVQKQAKISDGVRSQDTGYPRVRV